MHNEGASLRSIGDAAGLSHAGIKRILDRAH
jgi:lambda repressor-like predicted transcriptional regulator